MLKRDITFENFDGEQETETHYFNLTKTELVGIEASFPGGFEKAMKRIIEAQDNATLIQEFQKIILMSYGVRDGTRFVKNDEVRTAFSQTLAYDALFMELIQDEKKGADFINAVMPKDLDQDKPAAPPLPAPTPRS